MKDHYRLLTSQERSHLMSDGCWAEDWQQIHVCEDFDATRIQHTRFYGVNYLGRNTGTIELDSINLPCGIYHATLANCKIGDEVRIARVGSAIINYEIADHVVVEDVFEIKAEVGAHFGQGVTVDVLNEAGGRSVQLFSETNAQIAYLQALFRHDALFQEKLYDLIDKHITDHKPEHGFIGSGVHILHCGSLVNVIIGDNAHICRVSELTNGMILSSAEHATFIGTDVSAKNFIIAEGAHIEDGVVLDKVFVGQATRLGKQFSAENALLFANCEGFHSEVNSIFAGPYTVTHHRSTLLIASLFSFYNAGSGTNQSNHMYKLGPLHQGIFERGSKTGSFSYILLESHIPAFTVVIGKHLTNIDIPDLPFSYISEENGETILRPAINLFAIGTLRDGIKWPSRDRRKTLHKRDLIIFDVFSPYTVEKMRRGRDILLRFYASTPREKSSIHFGGATINRLLLSKGAKYYGFGIDRYLIEKVMVRLQPALSENLSWPEAQRSLQSTNITSHIADWMDLAGLIARRERIEQLMKDAVAGVIDSCAALSDVLQKIYHMYEEDEWNYVYDAFSKEYNVAPDKISPTEFMALIDKWENAVTSLNALLLDNAAKEFAPFSQIGFGLDWNEEQKQKDFLAVRGDMEKHTVIQQLKQEKQQLQERGRIYQADLARYLPK